MVESECELSNLPQVHCENSQHPVEFPCDRRMSTDVKLLKMAVVVRAVGLQLGGPGFSVPLLR